MNDEHDTILVTGATGNTGKAVAQALLDRGVVPAAMARKPADVARVPRGITDLRVADFDDADSIAAALEGVAGLYLVTPSSAEAEAQQIGFVDLAAAAGVRRIVLLSQLAAAADSPVRFLRYHAAVEQHIRDAGLGYTFLRPNLFFQGLLVFGPQIAATGRFGAPIGDAAVSAVDVRDIGAVGAAALAEPGHDGSTYTLTGPEAVTHARIAEALTAAVGTPVRFEDSDPDAFRDQLSGLLPAWQAAGLVEDYAHYRAGQAAFVTTDVQDVTGKPPRSLQDFSHDFADAFR